MSTSSFGYSASVAASVHTLNSHSLDSRIVQESQQQLDYCNAFVKHLGNHWHNCARIVRTYTSSILTTGPIFVCTPCR